MVNTVTRGAQWIIWAGQWPRGGTRCLGPHQLAWWLRSQGQDCQVIDFCQWLSSEELVELTELFIGPETRFMGISTVFMPESVPPNILRAQQEIIRARPQLTWLIGGPRSDSRDYHSLSGQRIQGKAEDRISELLGTALRFDICGLEHRWHRFDCVQPRECLPIELGRGCVFRCRFCAHENLGKPRWSYQRRGDLIAAEIQATHSEYAVSDWMFMDDTVNEDPERVQWLSELRRLTGIPDLTWVGYLRADLIDRRPEQRDQLRDSGLLSPFFGIETLHPRAAQSIGKGWSGREAQQSLPRLYEYWQRKIPLWTNWIIGLPGERESDLRNTLAYCRDNPWGMHRFVPLSLYTQRTDSGARSQFADQAAQWGYSIDNQGLWHTDTMNLGRAHELCLEFNQNVERQSTLSAWLLSDLRNSVTSYSELLGRPLRDQHSIRANFTQRFLKNYLRDLRQCSLER